MFNIRSLHSLTGTNPKMILSLGKLPRFILEAIKWVRMGGKISKLYPQLADYSDSAGSMRGHYFHQDILVSQSIFEKAPNHHIDIGSRIDGFVAHVASFRKIKILDIRPLECSQHPNIEFLQHDLMQDSEIDPADSVSCLHAIEHFGLGRYGDPIDINGHIKGTRNISKLVKHNGTLYISFPVASKSRIEFNAHRVFQPKQFLEDTELLKYFSVEKFDFIDDEGRVWKNFDYKKIENAYYACGIFTLRKIV